MPATVPNQRVIRIHRERASSDFLGIKNENYGIWVMDKSPYSTKEVKSFRYNLNGVNALADAFNVQNYSLA